MVLCPALPALATLGEDTNRIQSCVTQQKVTKANRAMENAILCYLYKKMGKLLTPVFMGLTIEMVFSPALLAFATLVDKT